MSEDAKNEPGETSVDAGETIGRAQQDPGVAAVVKAANVAKTFSNTDISGDRVNVPDIQVFGNGDLFKLISKASSQGEGWMKSTKALDTGTGVVIQVTTQQRNADGSYAVAEALTFVPGVAVIEDHDGVRRIGIR